MKRPRKFYIGKVMYGEWLVPIKHYYQVIRMNELVFEVIFPFILSIGLVVIYSRYASVSNALNKLEELLPNVLAILIGFTISGIALLASADPNQVTLLKHECSGRQIKAGKNITLHRLMLINFTYSLIIQVLFLISIFSVGYMLSIVSYPLLLDAILLVEVFLTLHILLNLIRMITNLYYVYMR